VKLAFLVVLFLAGMVAVIIGLHMIHPGLMIAAAGAFAIRHALMFDERSRRNEA